MVSAHMATIPAFLESYRKHKARCRPSQAKPTEPARPVRRMTRKRALLRIAEAADQPGPKRVRVRGMIAEPRAKRVRVEVEAAIAEVEAAELGVADTNLNVGEAMAG